METGDAKKVERRRATKQVQRLRSTFSRRILEKHQHVKLRKLSRRRKYFEDQYGKRYCIVGGGSWHGVPQEIIEESAKRSDDVLVVASDTSTSFTVFSGNLNELAHRRNSLTRNQKGEYHFNLETRGTSLVIKEVPDVRLVRIGIVSKPASAHVATQNSSQEASKKIIRGHIRNGRVLSDELVMLPEGTGLRIHILPEITEDIHPDVLRFSGIIAPAEDIRAEYHLSRSLEGS